MTTAAIPRRSLWDVIIVEPLDLVKAQPHQILLSTGSVAIMGQFAGSSGIVHPLVGYCIAVGVEWAYLRGLASNTRAQTIWGDILNWSAFLIVILWGVLWVGEVMQVIDHPTGFAGWLLASAHVVPVAWLSLCSAMCHSAAMREEARQAAQHVAEERERQRLADEQRRAFELGQAAEDAKLKRWEQAQRVKAEMKRADAEMPRHPASNAGKALPESMNAEQQVCPKCGAQLDRARWMAAKRWGYCKACKEV